jgi:hypothetical protein
MDDVSAQNPSRGPQVVRANADAQGPQSKVDELKPLLRTRDMTRQRRQLTLTPLRRIGDIEQLHANRCLADRDACREAFDL